MKFGIKHLAAFDKKKGQDAADFSVAFDVMIMGIVTEGFLQDALPGRAMKERGRRRPFDIVIPGCICLFA